MATNPGGLAARRRRWCARRWPRCPFVVVSDCIAETDTARFAHVKLPALGWGEKDGTVTNSRAHDQPPARAAAARRARRGPTGGSSPRSRRAMGWRDAFAYDRPGRHLPRARPALGLSQRRRAAVRHRPPRGAGQRRSTTRWSRSAGAARRSPTAASRRPTARRGWSRSSSARSTAPLPKWPLTLNTGRYRDQWHTMTRTGLSPKLSQHRREPLVEIHPARRRGARASTSGDLVAGLDAAGRQRVPRRAQRRASAAARSSCRSTGPTASRAAAAPACCRAPLVDPHSGQPGFKATPARIEQLARRMARLPDRAHGARADPGGLFHQGPRRRRAGWSSWPATAIRRALAKALLPKGERVEIVDARARRHAHRGARRRPAQRRALSSPAAAACPTATG